jgi:hypothetical protein
MAEFLRELKTLEAQVPELIKNVDGRLMLIIVMIKLKNDSMQLGWIC